MVLKDVVNFKGSLSIRPMQIVDIPKIVHYWTEASVEDLERMGANVARIPSPAQMASDLKKLCESYKSPYEQIRTFYSIWCVNGLSIGFSSLKNIVFSESGEMHLHMWEPSVRGKGYGRSLFCLSAVEFYDLFQLKKVICEPRSTNYFPNSMLQKLGFPLIKTHTKASSELSLFCELNQYDIQKSIAQSYLERNSVLKPSS